MSSGRPEDRQPLAEVAHPRVVQVEVGPAGQRPERHLLLDVDHEGRVAPLLRIRCRSRPGEVMILRGWAVRSSKLNFSLRRATLRWLSDSPVRFSSGAQDFMADRAVGLGREHEDRLGHLPAGLERRHALAHPGSGDRAELLLELGVLLLGRPHDPLGAHPRPGGQRTEGRHHAVGVGVVPVDDREVGHGLAGHRLALALAPVQHLGLGDLAGAVVQQRARHQVLRLRRGGRRRVRRTSAAMVLNWSQLVRASQGGSTAGLKGWMKGCMSVVLRSCISYQPAAGSATSAYMALVDMRISKVTSRSSLPSGAGSRQRDLLRPERALRC